MYCDGACDWYEAAVLIPFSVFLAGLLIVTYVIYRLVIRFRRNRRDSP